MFNLKFTVMEFKKNEQPYFVRIGKSGITTVELKPYCAYGNSKVIGRHESYNFDVLSDISDNIPVLDCRNTDDDQILKFILRTNCPGSLIQFVGNDEKLNEALQIYCNEAKKYGYQVLTVKEFLQNEKAK